MFDSRTIAKRVWQDHGPIGEGVTGSRNVMTEDGVEYIAKADGWAPSGAPGTHVLLQEWICARLAETIGVPIPEYSLLDFWGKPCFGSRKLRLESPKFVSVLVPRLGNPEAIYLIAAFDAWVFNSDRHASNLVITMQNQRYSLVAIDHSHCPLHGRESFDQIEHLRDVPAVHAVQGFLRKHLVDREQLVRSVQRVQNLDDDLIHSLIRPPVEISCSLEEQEQFANHLIHRRNTIRDLFNVHRDAFPAIKDHPL